MPAPNQIHDELLFPEIQLHTINMDDGRKVAYSYTTGQTSSSSVPILFFYPAGSSRRMLVSLAKELSHLRFVCVNRPGRGGTSPASKGTSHLDTTVQDAVAVLDKLGIDKVSLLCMCAGAPFGMAFALHQKDRISGIFMGISTWVQPADCGYQNTKFPYYFGTLMPFVASPLVESVITSIGSSLSSFPTTWVLSTLRGRISESEHELFDIKYEDGKEFSEMMKWMQQERGGKGNDVEILLNAGLIDYQTISKNLKSITLWHGTKDAVVPYASAQWLEERIAGAILYTIPEGSHEGCMFLLHSSIIESLKSFGKGRDNDN